ncbi:MAG: hypothetical protein EPN82_09175 [Bacteroidetes bacterium]|nr:MAG: hypothetical protein EPN82_09175 [Bacteroidota bacterium]
MKIIKYITLLLNLFFLTNCDDNTSPPQDTINYYPLNNGNYWVYDSYDLDINNKKIIGTERRDSIIVNDIIEYEGKSAYQLQVFRNNILFDTLYFSQESSKVYMIFDENEIDVPGFNKKWFLIADFSKINDTEWHIYDTILENYPFNFRDSTLFTTYHQTLNGKLESTENYQLNNKSYKSMLFQVRYDKRLYFMYKFPDDVSVKELEVNRITKRLLHFTFAENLGLVQIKYDPYETSFSTNPSTSFTLSAEFNGRQSDLIYYRIIINENKD